MREGSIERSVVNAGIEWYGRKVLMIADVFSSWILQALDGYRWSRTRLSLPEPSNQPLNGLDSWHQSQPAACESQESVDLLVQLLILGFAELRSILVLTFDTEDGRLESCEPRIQLAQLLESLVACCEECLVALRRSDPGLPNQGLGMGGLLGLDVQTRL